MKKPETIDTIDQIDSKILKQKGEVEVYKLTPKAVIFVDIEGYSQIIYQCWNDESKMKGFCNLMTVF